jgi:hypothetical protein
VLLICPPLALLFSVIGLVNDHRKGYAVASLLASAGLLVAFLLLLH